MYKCVYIYICLQLVGVIDQQTYRLGAPLCMVDSPACLAIVGICLHINTRDGLDSFVL